MIPQSNLLAAATLFACASTLSALQNPADSVQPSDIVLKVENFVQMPDSGNSPEYTRISMIKEAPDGSGRLFVSDLRGRISLISGTSATVYMNYSSRIGAAFKPTPGMGSGLANFAFHPEFATNGKFYTAHTEAANTATADFTTPTPVTMEFQSVLVEWTANNPAANTFVGTSRELLRVDLPGRLHGPQDLGFNPNAKPGDPDYGILYHSIGDGGSMINGNPENVGRKDSILGTIIRIDPAGNNSANGKYGIPSDNPFVGETGVIQEIYAYGFRNPHRFTWDIDGKMIEADIGEMNIEEINLIIPGGNYGWPDREGTWVFDRTSKDKGQQIYALPNNDAELGYIYPVAMYDHADSLAAISGGVVYRGRQNPELYGKYIFGDVREGRVFYIEADEIELGKLLPIKEIGIQNAAGQNIDIRSMVRQRVSNTFRADLRIAADAAGELFILTKPDGKIRRFVSTAPERQSPFAGPLGQKDTWLGSLNDSTYPWIEHQGMNWLYAETDDAENFWFYHSDLNLWMWTAESTTPWFWITR